MGHCIVTHALLVSWAKTVVHWSMMPCRVAEIVADVSEEPAAPNKRVGSTLLELCFCFPL